MQLSVSLFREKLVFIQFKLLFLWQFQYLSVLTVFFSNTCRACHESTVFIQVPVVHVMNLLFLFKYLSCMPWILVFKWSYKFKLFFRCVDLSDNSSFYFFCSNGLAFVPPVVFECLQKRLRFGRWRRALLALSCSKPRKLVRTVINWLNRVNTILSMYVSMATLKISNDSFKGTYRVNKLIN